MFIYIIHILIENIRICIHIQKIKMNMNMILTTRGGLGWEGGGKGTPPPPGF
jgi:hypothetical protein